MDAEDINHLMTVEIPSQKISTNLRIPVAKRTTIGVKSFCFFCIKYNHITSSSLLSNILFQAFDKVNIIFGFA